MSRNYQIISDTEFKVIMAACLFGIFMGIIAIVITIKNLIGW